MDTRCRFNAPVSFLHPLPSVLLNAQGAGHQSPTACQVASNRRSTLATDFLVFLIETRRPGVSHGLLPFLRQSATLPILRLTRTLDVRVWVVSVSDSAGI